MGGADRVGGSPRDLDYEPELAAAPAVPNANQAGGGGKDDSIPVTGMTPPNPFAKYELDLPLGVRINRFLIPISLIRRKTPVILPTPIVQAPPPPVPAQPDPQPRQPSTEELTLADYQQRWAQARRVGRPKDHNRASESLRTKATGIWKSTANLGYPDRRCEHLGR